MKTKIVPFMQASIFIGSRRGYHGESFSEGHLTRVIQDFQTSWDVRADWTVPLRITKTLYVVMDRVEPGWEITAINYPRFEKTSKQIESFMSELQEHLLVELQQNRITLTLDFLNQAGDNQRRIKLVERDNAEQSHK